MGGGALFHSACTTLRSISMTEEFSDGTKSKSTAVMEIGLPAVPAMGQGRVILPQEKNPCGGGGTPHPPSCEKGGPGGNSPGFSDEDCGKISYRTLPGCSRSGIKLGGGYPCHPPVVLGGYPPSKKTGWGGRYPLPPTSGHIIARVRCYRMK